MIPKNVKVKDINAINKNTLIDTLGIEFTEVGSDYIVGKMPVDERTFQPMGLLHGGANVALAETLGSTGTYLMIGTKTHYGVCIEINANHVGSIMDGYVYGKAEIVHKGKTTHIWKIEIKDEHGKMISIARLTMMILERK
ncbi:MAG: hotdog fold thioesterase [Flavobacteriales bacterium]|jgi:1,4-dihydroxy-2-naphthoyl-CoA hydrolase|nr:hotdog fold thioesterase [Flavobacteriales bacterium]